MAPRHFKSPRYSAYKWISVSVKMTVVTFISCWRQWKTNWSLLRFLP